MNRKGKNNATTAQAGDVGSPWGIGSYLGGHKSTHLELALLMIFNYWSRQHKTWNWGCYELCLASCARSSVCKRFSTMVQLATRKNIAIYRKSSKKIPRYSTHLFWKWRLEKFIERTIGCSTFLDCRMQYQNLQSWQSSHETFLFLGLAHRWNKEKASRCFISCRSFYASKNYERVG